jgi:hypothetical protein
MRGHAPVVRALINICTELALAVRRILDELPLRVLRRRHAVVWLDGRYRALYFERSFVLILSLL